MDMRILHFVNGRLNPESANGVDKSVYYLSKNQALFGNTICVFSLTKKEPINIQGVKVFSFPPSINPFFLPSSLYKNLLQWAPQIVHLHSAFVPQNWVLSRWLRKHDIPYVVTPHGGLNHYVLIRNWFIKNIYRFLFELPLLNHAAFVHAIADEADIKKYGAKAPIITAPNGLDLASLPARYNPNYLIKMHPELVGKRIFLFIGRLDPFIKGLDLLVDAFAKIDNDNAILILVGPDCKNGLRSLREQVSKRQLENKVVFWGPAFGQEKYDILASADICLQPSRSEAGLPFSILEACASKKACLISDTADRMGLFNKYKSGIVVKTKIDDIAVGLERFVKMKSNSIVEMGVNAQKMIESEFKWENISSKLVDGYRTYATR